MDTSLYDLDTNNILTNLSSFGESSLDERVDNDHAWGREIIFHMGSKEEPYTLKLLELQKPHVLSSYHHHRNIHETLVVLAGVVSIRVESTMFRLYYPGGLIHIPPLHDHQFFAVQDPAVLMEGSNRIDPNDDVKVEHGAESQFIFGDGR